MTAEKKQCLLKYLGFYQGGVDGEWGPRSHAATEAFQRQHNLDVDGIFGPVTEKQALEAVYNGEFAPEPPREKPNGGAAAGAPAWWAEIKYFRRDEPYIACSCGKCGGFPVEPSEKLMRLADKVREHEGIPGVPTSTVRCKDHNAAVGGVYNSRHLLGNAMDIFFPGVDPLAVDAYLAKCPECAYHYPIRRDGKLTGAVHMDVVL